MKSLVKVSTMEDRGVHARYYKVGHKGGKSEGVWKRSVSKKKSQY